MQQDEISPFALLLNGGGAPSWVLRAQGVAAAIDFDFAGGRYYQTGIELGASPNRLLTITRASTAYEDDSTGLWHSFGNNVLRVTNKGTLIEESRTNVVLWDRDLTNAAWTATSVTVAKDQTGIDGAANSASSLTATAGNGTVLQAVTLASSARAQSAFVKRITGTGVVDMTMDNGVTWTAITVTSAWKQVSIPTQTLANPTVGFKIVTSGDAIAVDFVQNENGTFPTSPILTTTVAATRAADVVSVTKVPRFGNSYTMFSQLLPMLAASDNFIVTFSDGTFTNYSGVLRPVATALINGRLVVGNTVILNTGPGNTISLGTTARAALALGPSSQVVADNGQIYSASVAGNPGTVTTISIGSSLGSTFADCYVQRVAVWPTMRVPNGELTRLTR